MGILVDSMRFFGSFHRTEWNLNGNGTEWTVYGQAMVSVLWQISSQCSRHFLRVAASPVASRQAEDDYEGSLNGEEGGVPSIRVMRPPYSPLAKDHEWVAKGPKHCASAIRVSMAF